MKRIKDPKELLDRALANDDPELIPDMYDDNDWRTENRLAEMADNDRKYQAERTDR